MVKLTLESSIFSGKDEVPVPSSTSVVSPMRNRRIVAENRVEGNVSLIAVAEVFCPRVHFFLSSGVPRHFASERVSLALPTIGADPHFALQRIGLLLHVFALEVFKDRNKDRALHLSEYGKIFGVLGHRH